MKSWMRQAVTDPVWTRGEIFETSNNDASGEVATFAYYSDRIGVARLRLKAENGATRSLECSRAKTVFCLLC